MSKRFLRFPVLFLFLNIFSLSVKLHAENSDFNGRDLPTQDQKLLQEKDALDLNKINSSVDAGSFYSIELSITQFEENFAKMAQDLKRLREQVEFAKQMEQKRLEQIRKLEQENAKLHQLWLDNSFDNSWSGTADKLENFDNKRSETEPAQPMAARQDVVVEIIENKANQF